MAALLHDSLLQGFILKRCPIINAFRKHWKLRPYCRWSANVDTCVEIFLWSSDTRNPSLFSGTRVGEVGELFQTDAARLFCTTAEQDED